MMTKRMPARVMPPGRTITRELEARGWTQKDLAAIMGRPEQAISQIINGEKEITPETAIELSKAFGTSAQFWNNLEANYRLWLAAKDKKPKSIERRARLYSVAPVAEMKRKNWLPKVNDIDKIERAYLELMDIKSMDEKPMCALNRRKSPVKDADVRSQIIWVKRVESLVRNQRVDRFDVNSLRKSIPELLEYSTRVKDAAEVPAFLMRLGIHFALVPHLERTYLDGAVFRLNSKPVVALTLRYDRIDSFWFTLMHELAHLVAGHEGIILDAIYAQDRIVGRKEREADKIAQDWLVDPDAYRDFVNSTRPYFSAKRIRQFAEGIERHPAIVLGRLQFDGEVGWNNLQKLREKVKPAVMDYFDKPITA